MRTRTVAAVLALTLAAPAAWANAIIVDRPTPPPPPPPPPPGTVKLEPTVAGVAACLAAVALGLWLQRRAARPVPQVSVA